MDDRTDQAIEELGNLVAMAGGEGDEALDVFKDLASDVQQLRRELGRAEQRFANEQVRRMRESGFCPCCGAEEDGRSWR